MDRNIKELDKVIPIHNIYYMLAYAFQVLNEQGYKSIATEKFGNVAELCAAILSKGVSLQIKRGLGREYIQETEPLSSLRGRIEISESIKTGSIHKKQMVCSYDVFSENSYMNRIIKSTMELLLKADIAKERKKELRKLLVYLGNVDTLDIHSINWHLQYNRNNQTYIMLISICHFVIKGLLQSQTDGSVKVMDFLNEKRMHHLYEKFILEYYRREYPMIKTNASQIAWQLDDDYNDMLPVMQSDIMLNYKGDTLIVDAKYYGQSLQMQYDKYSIISGNLYQIFTYVKNKDIEMKQKGQGRVSGMLLYAKTDAEVYPQNKYKMSGNDIEVRTLDLSGDFAEIRRQLDSIVEQYFDICLSRG